MTLHKIGAALLALVLSTGASANAAPSEPPAFDLEPVRSVWLATINDYQVLNSSALILWSSPGRGYLVQLQRPTHSPLAFSWRLKLTSTGDSIYPRFDAAIVDGIRYPIAAIYRIDREQAKALAARYR